MPYRKNYRKRVFKKKGGWAKKALGYAGTAVKALALAKKVADMVNVEYKFQPVTIGTTVNSTGLILQNIFSTTQGVGESEHTGDSIKVQRFSGRMSFVQHASAKSTIVRMVIFKGKQERGAATPYTINDILFDGNTTSVLSPKNFDERFNTKVIYDRTMTLSSSGTTVKVLDINLPINWHVEYESGLSSINNGGLYFALISNEATNTPTVTGSLKFTYTDN